MKRILGAFMILGALLLACSVIYSLWADGFRNWGRVSAFGFCIGLVVVGSMWLRGTRPPSVDAVAPGHKRLPFSEQLDRVDLSRDDSFPVNDLGQVSLAGWCLALVSTAVTLAVGVTGALLVSGDAKTLDKSDWRPLLMIGAGFAAGFCVFQIGKRILWRCGQTVRLQRRSRKPPFQAVQRFGDAQTARDVPGDDDRDTNIAEKKRWRGKPQDG